MLIFSRHFNEMLIQRNIDESWVHRTVDQPDRVDRHDEGATLHYLKKIVERNNRWLRIVVNVDEIPHKAVTAFFDRRLRRQT